MNTPTLNRLLSVGTLCILSLTLHAQESKVRWKIFADFKAVPNEGTVFAKVAKGDAGSFVALQVKGNSPVIGGMNQVELDRSLVAFSVAGPAVIKTDKTKILWGEGPVAIETIERFANQFRVIATKPDPEKGKLLLIQQILSPRALTGKGGQLLTEIPYDRLGKGSDYFKPNTAVGFTTTVSVDSTLMLIGLSPESTTRSAGCPIYAQVFDKQMKLLWSNTLTPPSAARSFEIITTHVDPAGAVWYLLKNVTNPTPKTREELGYSFSLYRLDSAGQQGFELKLSGKDFAQDATLDMRMDGSIVLAGTYGNEESERNGSVGAFQCVFDAKAQKFDRFKLYPFNKQVIKKEEEFQTNMVIDRVFWKKNGGTYIVTRKSGVETHYVADLSGKKTAKTEQVEGALHLFETDASGEKRWYRVFDRELSYDNAVPGTVISMVYDDVLFLLMNDAEGNIEKRKLKEPLDPITAMRDAIFVEIKGDGGDKTKKVLEGAAFQQLGIQAAQVWFPAPGLIVTNGSEGFGKSKTWPVVITLSSETKK